MGISSSTKLEYQRLHNIAKNNSQVIAAAVLIDAEDIYDKELADMKKEVLIEIFIAGYIAAKSGD